MGDTEKGGYVELLRQQTALARFGELALRSDDLEEILTEACRLAGEALGTDLAKVVELQEDGKTLLVRAGVGWEPGVIGVATITAEQTPRKAMPSDGRADDLARHRDRNAVQVSAFLDRQQCQGGCQCPHHRRQGQAALRHPANRQPRAPPVHRERHAFLRSYANLFAAAVDRLSLRLARWRREEAAGGKVAPAS